MRRTQVYLNEEDYQKLMHLSRSRQQSMAEMVRDAVRRFLNEETEDGARDLLAQAFGAWGEREETTQAIVRKSRAEWAARETRHGSRH